MIGAAGELRDCRRNGAGIAVAPSVMMPRASLLPCLTVAVAGCAAPPLGLGTGAHLHAAVPGQVASAFGAGFARDRQTLQLDTAYTLDRRGRRTDDVGVVLTQLGAATDTGSQRYYGAIPYYRPRWTFGRTSLALAVSGFAATGGEDGAVGAIVDGQLGVGGDHWSVYTGVYGFGVANTIGAQSLAAQGRVGGEVLLDTGGARIGLAVEGYLQADSLGGMAVGGAMIDRIEAVQPGLGIKLRVEGLGRSANARARSPRR